MKWNAQCIQGGARRREPVYRACPVPPSVSLSVLSPRLSAVEAALEVEVQLQYAPLEDGPEARLAMDVPLPVDDLR